MTHAADTQDVFDSIWKDDLLGRRSEADFLLRFLVHRAQIRAMADEAGAYVLNIDAEWGQGKSFFMRHFLEHIRAHNYPAVYVDAWEDDFTSEPLTAVMSAIDELVAPLIKGNKKGMSAARKFLVATKRNFGRIAITAGVGAVKKGATKLIGSAAEEVVELYRSDGAPSSEAATLAEEMAGSAKESVSANVEALLDKFAESQIERFKEAKTSLVDFRTNLEAFLKQLTEAQEGELRLPFFILIDELDRCRPTYAVEMLERIKHLFDVPNVVFVLSTNTVQLSHAVGAVYGSNFNGLNYLDRFFHRTYMMPLPEKEMMIEYLLSSHKIELTDIKFPGTLQPFIEFISYVDRCADLTLRELQRVVEILSALVAVWRDPHRKIDALVMVPMIAAFVKKQDISKDTFQKWVAKSLDKSWGIPIEHRTGYSQPTIERLYASEYVKKLLDYTDGSAREGYNKYQKDNNHDYSSRSHVAAERIILENEVSTALHAEVQAANASGDTHAPNSLNYYEDHIRHAGRLTAGVRGSQSREDAKQ